MRPNLVLVGFMGAGKSTVGRLAAQALGATFVDSDAVIEARAGKRISEIFAQDGEAAFRALERDVIRALAEERELVIATGGGAFVDEGVREFLNRTAVTAYLKAPFDVLWSRVAGATDRPLLMGSGAKERAAALLESRVPVYEMAHFWVDAAKPAPEVAEELLRKYDECIRRKQHA